MVTASKVQHSRTPNGPLPPAQPCQPVAQPQVGMLHVTTDENSWSGLRQLNEEAGSVAGRSTSSNGGFGHPYANSQADSTEDYSNVPLCFGEQLVLETYMRFRGRRYDRKRQDELSRPRNVKQSPNDQWGHTPGGRTNALEKDEVDQMLERLAKPRRQPMALEPPSLVLHSAKSTAAHAGEVFRRLSSAKPHREFDPTPGEKVCMLYNAQQAGRSVNFDRLSAMAKPKRRPGHMDQTFASTLPHVYANTPRAITGGPPSLPSAPLSARATSSRAGTGAAPMSAATAASSVEKLPEVESHPDDNVRLQAVVAGEERSEEYMDDLEEESDEQLSLGAAPPLPPYPPVSYGGGEAGPVAAAAARWQASQPTVTNQYEDEDSEGEEPLFPQFGLGGQRLKPGSR
eukprot:TRINITY_DN100397_c0_g1_i1.p1 TRINITY_DN100397_c0_g1~~TRINITY_DN100397_c0_g1_i1.p1  ORF type:complete len:400 (+),score=62.83 TRINITY_DN100397_c0_g1_i1:70-1269(+)